MPRRVNLPGASELFRKTETGEATGGQPQTPSSAGAPAKPGAGGAGATSSTSRGAAVAEGHTGRVRHNEKMTVYLSTEELTALEQARLTLRSSHDLKVDRGRIVRAAIAQVLADLERSGAEAELVQRLRDE